MVITPTLNDVGRCAESAPFINGNSLHKEDNVVDKLVRNGNIVLNMTETPNHNYNVPEKGTIDWHTELNKNFENLEVDIEIRDIEANKGDYEPKSGAKYEATDSGAVYYANGNSWVLADRKIGSLRVKTLSPVEAEEVSQSLSAAISSGFVVGETLAHNMAVFDPRNFDTDDAAIQAANDWVISSDHKQRGGTVHIPSIGPDRAGLTIENTVVFAETGDSEVNAPVSIIQHSPGRISDTITTTITDGSPMFDVRNDARNGIQNWYGDYYFNGWVDMQGNDADFLYITDHNRCDVYVRYLDNLAGDGIIIDGSFYNSKIFVHASGHNGNGRVIVEKDTTGHGPPGNYQLLPGTMIGGRVECSIATDQTTGGPMSWISGFHETAHGRAQFNLTQGQFMFTDMCSINSTEDGAHGIYFSGDMLWSYVSEIKQCDGDGIHFESGTDLYVQPFYGQGNGGDSINVVNEPGQTGAVPYDHQIRGTVNYPSGRWDSGLAYLDGRRRFREPTIVNIGGGTTKTVQSYAGFSGKKYEVVWGFANDPSANVHVEVDSGYFNTSTGQREVRISETTGNTNVDIVYTIIERPSV